MESEARLAVEEIGGKREEQERRKADDLVRVPSRISKMAPACRASGKGERQREKSQTRRMEMENLKDGER